MTYMPPGTKWMGNRMEREKNEHFNQCFHEITNVVTVYSFEFAQSYFRPIRI